jgi:hypothetical protein
LKNLIPQKIQDADGFGQNEERLRLPMASDPSAALAMK